MPDLLNLYDIAQASGHQSIYVVPDRCVPVQHRRSSCRRCIDFCPAEAIAYENRTLKVSNAACIGCGACATVCPTEALIPLDTTEAVLRRDALAAMSHNKGVACFACARVAARENVRSEHYAEVPCLSRVNESVMLELVADGAERVLLVDGGCSNCKYRDCDEVTRVVEENARHLLEVQGSPVVVERVHAFPAGFEVKPQEKVGASRRAAFEDAGATTKGLLGRAAKILIKQEAAQSKASAAVIGMLGLDADDPEPLAPRRQERLLDALFAIGEANGQELFLPDEGSGLGSAASQPGPGEAAASVETSPSGEGASPDEPEVPPVDCRYFGMVELDPLKCNRCGICAVVCKQDALNRTDKKTASGERAFLEFEPALCVQCNLCNEACFRKAITVGSQVALRDLFSFEPLLINA